MNRLARAAASAGPLLPGIPRGTGRGNLNRMEVNEMLDAATICELADRRRDPTRAAFHQMLTERRAYPPGSPDHSYRTRAARKLVWLMRGIPVSKWSTP